MTKLPRERETKVLYSIRTRLYRRFGIRLWRRNIGEMRRGERTIRFGAPGQSDLYGFMPRSHRCPCQHVELEIKRPGNRPTPMQLEWLRTMHDLGAIALWGDNTNDVERVMEAILQGGKVIWCDNDDYYIEMP